MSLSSICIRRPVFATVLSLIILLLGVVSYNRLQVREYPKIDEPVVTVTTTYTGASAEIVETQVSKILEDSLAGIEGVDVLTSISRAERSQISVRFVLERDPDQAASDVRDRVSRVRGKLPDDIDDPIIAKVEADANPIIWLCFMSDDLSQMNISDYAKRIIKPKLQTLPGMADIRISGERTITMRIWLEPEKLAGYGITVQDVEEAVARQNVEIPAGRIESSNREFTVLAETDLNTPEQFEEVIIKEVNGYPIKIRDVAKVGLAPEDERSLVRFNGKNAVSLGLIKQATANPLELGKALKQMLPRLNEDLPEGMELAISSDSTIFIERSIQSVFKTIFEAVVLVALVILFFLRSFRASLIPLVTIPVSLIGTFLLIYIFGFSVNTLTLLALVLAIGLVVDDAIVMLENIYRHIEDGMKPFDAAMKGANEIGFAVIAMTITLAAVYAPIAFMTGRTGKLFIEFALTLAGSVMISGFIALTLSPMMCSKLLRHEKKHNKLYNWIENGMVRMSEGYRVLLLATLKVRWLMVLIAIGIGAIAYFMMVTMKSELAPIEDRGRISATLNAPEGATIAYMDHYAAQLEKFYMDIPEADRSFIILGFPTVSQGSSFLGLVDWEDRKRSSQEIAASLRPLMNDISGFTAFPILPPSLGQGMRTRPITYLIITSEPYSELEKVTNKFIEKISENKGLLNIDTDLRLTKPELRIQVDRERASNYGVDVEVIGRTIETMLGGRKNTRFKLNGEQYDVIIKLSDSDRMNPGDIQNIYVRSNGGSMVPLSHLVKSVEAVAPRELNHFGQQRAVSITANLTPDYALGDALNYLDETAKEVLPIGYTTDLNNISREFRTSSSSLYAIFFLALLFIYLVLAAQFESFTDPLIILVTVPLSMTGALLALQWSGCTLNVYSQIGLVTLIGLITKHGILLVEFANQLQEEGKDVLGAIIESAELRLRPILMTTGATVLGALPLAFATGAGAESRHQIGWVIVGGMTFGTILTLFIIPTIYSMCGKKKFIHTENNSETAVIFEKNKTI